MVIQALCLSDRITRSRETPVRAIYRTSLRPMRRWTSSALRPMREQVGGACRLGEAGINFERRGRRLLERPACWVSFVCHSAVFIRDRLTQSVLKKNHGTFCFSFSLDTCSYLLGALSFIPSRSLTRHSSALPPNPSTVLALSTSLTPSPSDPAPAPNSLPGQPQEHPSNKQLAKYQLPPAALSAHLRAAVLRMGEERSGSRERQRGETGQPRSTNSSRSSSPEHGAVRHSRRRLEITPETARLLHKAGHAPGIQAHSHPSPVKHEAGPDTSNGTPGDCGETESKDKRHSLGKLNSNQSNNKPGDQGRDSDRQIKRHPQDERTAQKILSGLKLKRNHSGKGEQVQFV